MTTLKFSVGRFTRAQRNAVWFRRRNCRVVSARRELIEDGPVQVEQQLIPRNDILMLASGADRPASKACQSASPRLCLCVPGRLAV